MKRTVKQPKHTGKITAEQARKAVRAARDGMTDINSIINTFICEDGGCLCCHYRAEALQETLSDAGYVIVPREPTTV